MRTRRPGAFERFRVLPSIECGATIPRMAREGVPRIDFRVWSDVLCPWCQNAAVVLEKVQEDVREFADLHLEWKSYLLRPRPEPKSLDKFRRYTESWMRPASMPDGGEFRVWATDEDPPSHSIPPAIAVKAAARQEEARERSGLDPLPSYHRALMRAYFVRNLNVSARAVLELVARECGLESRQFARDLDDPALAELVIAEHNQAVELGISGVPCVVVGEGFAMPGAQERAVYINVARKIASHLGAA
jgi:predicted DsbA family dithiol-disulfide isomerase